MLIVDMVNLGENYGNDNTGLCNPVFGDEVRVGRVGKDGEGDVLLSWKAGPSIWIVVGKTSTFLIGIVLISFEEGTSQNLPVDLPVHLRT